MSQDTLNPVFGPLDVMALVFDANGNEIEGRTAIQHLTYFVSQRIVNSDISYEPHHFGPSSAEVYSLLVDYCIAGRAYEIFRWQGDHRMHKYVITDFGQEVTRLLLDEHPPETIKTIQETIKICKDACNLRPDDLSNAAKVHYALTNYSTRKVAAQPQTVSDIHDVAYRFRWNMSDSSIRAGHALLRKLHLASQPVQS